MILSLIGPGDIDFHYHTLLKIPKDTFDYELEKISKVIADSRWEIELLPDKGISLEIAKKYKEFSGKKIIGSVPKSDNVFGIRHLNKYLDLQIENNNLFDEIVDTNDWFKQDVIKGLLGNAVLYLGNSPGSMGELNYAVYLYKLINSFKDHVEFFSKKIHPSIIADKNYTFFIYKPFLSNKKLSEEEEAYAKKFGIRVVYINNSEELKSYLENF